MTCGSGGPLVTLRRGRSGMRAQLAYRRSRWFFLAALMLGAASLFLHSQAGAVAGYPGPIGRPGIPAGPPLGTISPGGGTGTTYICGFQPGTPITFKVNGTQVGPGFGNADSNGCVAFSASAGPGPTVTITTFSKNGPITLGPVPGNFGNNTIAASGLGGPGAGADRGKIIGLSELLVINDVAPPSTTTPTTTPITTPTTTPVTIPVVPTTTSPGSTTSTTTPGGTTTTTVPGSTTTTGAAPTTTLAPFDPSTAPITQHLQGAVALLGGVAAAAAATAGAAAAASGAAAGGAAGGSAGGAAGGVPGSGAPGGSGGSEGTGGSGGSGGSEGSGGSGAQGGSGGSEGSGGSSGRGGSGARGGSGDSEGSEGSGGSGGSEGAGGSGGSEGAGGSGGNSFTDGGA